MHVPGGDHVHLGVLPAGCERYMQLAAQDAARRNQGVARGTIGCAGNPH